ncbi:MAG: mechanosensitive ion channel [Rhodospirillales bacterium]|nr:mechanosensitive ion channel [Rhodospirillales bacterium]
MKRALLALVLLVAAAAGAFAQGGPAAQQVLAPSAAQARQALEVLQNPARRAELIAVLEALAHLPAKPEPKTAAAPAASAPAGAAQPGAAQPGAAQPGAVQSGAPPALPLAPDSLGAQVLVGVSHRLATLSADIVSTVRAVTDFPLIWRFLVRLVSETWSQQLLMAISWKLVLVMAGGLAALWAARRLLERPAEALREGALAQRAAQAEVRPEDVGLAEAEAGQTERLRRRTAPLAILRRLPRALLRLLLNLLPVLALLAAGYGLLAAGLGAEPIARLVILGVLQAYALCRVVTSITRSLFGPGEPRLIPIPEQRAEYLLRWVRRIAAVAVFGTMLAEVGLLFGLYRVAHDALLKLVALVVDLFLVTMVLQGRAAVARAIRAREGAQGWLPLLRNRLAGLWHVVAIFYLAALWAVWALDVPDGFARMLRLFVVTAIIVTLARLAAVNLLAAIDRASHVAPTLSERYPGLEARIGTYHPLSRFLAKSMVGAVAGVALLQAWGFDALGWFESGALGGQLLSALVTIGITLLLALAVWEMANAAMQRQIGRLEGEAHLARAARLRTLLPMARTALLITIFLFAGLMVLSQIGINIAPLLAGAGVIGIAIGFGSQKLVQDIITGLFLLMENAMQVGDGVTLAGLSGVVENLSVRTIRLRALDGSVHIIPFSAVTTVTNATRDFSYAVLRIPVGLGEPPDKIVAMLQKLAADMREEPAWRAIIRSDFDVFGVDKFMVGYWVLLGRIRTGPGQGDPVMREFNRRLKYLFDKEAIDSPLTSLAALQREPPTIVTQPASGSLT